MAAQAARRALVRVLRWGGWALLWATAVASAALAVAALLAALPVTRPFAAATLVRIADDAVAGRLELDGIGVLPRGGVELRGLRAFDPEGRLVLRVERARLSADAVGLVARELGVSLELEGVDVDAALRAEDGGLALARAFSPTPRAARPGPPAAAGRPAGGRAEGGWTVRLARLTVAHGHVVAAGPNGEPLELGDAALDARGLWTPARGWLELRAGGAMGAPIAAPVTLAARVARDGDRLELERLSATMGRDRLEAVGEGDLSRGTGRLAVTRLGLSAEEAGALARGARLGGELDGTLYATSDGKVLTAAASVSPASKAAGSAEVAIAAHLPPGAPGWGFTADVDRLDPSRLSLLAPPGRVTLHGRGAWRGARLEELVGRIVLRVERSRLRGGEVGPMEVAATAGGGSVDVARLEATAPGGSVSGRLRWGAARQVDGELTVTAGDLGLLERNLEGVLGLKAAHLEGAGRASVKLSGTSKAPRLEATVDAARLVVGDVAAEGAHLAVSLVGPAATGAGTVKGGLARARVAGLELRAVQLDTALREEEAFLAFTANVPRLGTDPVRATLRGRFGDRRATFALADALIAWPGTRFALEGTARLDLATPSVDRLALVADGQRIEVEGGVRRGGKLDARLRLAGIDLARLPRGLAPAGAMPEGILAVDARVSGTPSAPRVDATVGVAGGSVYQVGGLRVDGDVAWDGGRRRLGGNLGLARALGGTLHASFELPIEPSRARAGEELRAELRGRDVPLDELVWLAGSYALVSGDVDVTATLGGTVGAPALRATVSGRNGTWDDLEGLALDATLDASSDRLRVRAAGALGGAPAATLDATVPLDLAGLLARPPEAIAEARRGPLALALRVSGLELAQLAGRLDLPIDLAGRVGAEVALEGSVAAPRGTVSLSVEEGAALGARKVGARLEVALAAARSVATLDLRLAGSPAAHAEGAIELPAARLLDRGALAAAPVHASVLLPRSELAAWGGDLLALRGAVEGKGALRGTLGVPEAELALSAAAAAVEGRPLGDAAVAVHYAAGRASARLDLRPPAGGALHAELAIERPLGVAAAPGPILSAPAELRVRADALDLGFLPALAPGLVRAASGAATLDVSAAGPLGELRPRGSVRVERGRFAIAELGDWTQATVEVALGPDAIELRRFDVRKGPGSLSVRGAIRGLERAGVPAELEATLQAREFGVERAGMELARFDLSAEARGQLDRSGLTLGVVVPQAEVKLPKRIPRTLQELDTRRDITVGRPKPARVRRHAPAAPPEGLAAAPPARAPFKTVIHFLAPRRLRVRADQPRIDVELKADAIFAYARGREEATGTVQVIRGQAEPIGGRVFVIERGKVTFTGGPIATGTLDLAARYDNPTAVVRATVGGTLRKPELHLSSEPPLQEAQIAMLVATGRTEVKAGTEGVNTLAAGEAGLAAAGAVAMGVFKDLLSDKLPVDSVSLDSTAVRAGKYLTDRIYVGYVRRFDAKPEKGENPDEVQVDYQLAPGWQVETRYGSGQSGGASIVWTKNY